MAKSKPIAVSANEKKWMVEDDMRTLRRAEEIKFDAKRMKAAQECAKKEMESMKSMMKMKPKGK